MYNCLPDLSPYFPWKQNIRPLEVLQTRVSDSTLAFQKWRLSPKSSALELDEVEEWISQRWTVSSSVCSRQIGSTDPQKGKWLVDLQPSRLEILIITDVSLVNNADQVNTIFWGFKKATMKADQVISPLSVYMYNRSRQFLNSVKRT